MEQYGEVRVESADRTLVAIVDKSMALGARKAGKWLLCKPGCSECCVGPFPITVLDAWRLHRGLAELGRRDQVRAAAVLRRARIVADRLKVDFPGDSRTGILWDDEETEESFCSRHSSVPCPVLDPQTSRCDLYEWRPLSCRTMGLPVRFGTHDLPPCHLSFRGAPASVIEECTVEPDPHGMEYTILQSCGRQIETIIAFALSHGTSL